MSRAACEEIARSAGVPVDDVLELWNERAAIREYEGGQSRTDAEAAALDDVRAMVAALSLAGEPRKGPRSVATLDVMPSKKLENE